MEFSQRDWSRGLIRPLSLAIVGTSSGIHGYEIATRLESLGLSEVSSGTLYPILRRLEDEGLLESEWAFGEGGPGKKVYHTTLMGKDELERFQLAWGSLVKNLKSLEGGTHDKT